MPLYLIPCAIVFALLSIPVVMKPGLAFSAQARACSDAPYEKMLQRADEATTRNNKREASRIFTDAAHSRLRCASQARGDERASLIDDFAGSIENAATAAVGAADYTNACRLAHEEVGVLQDQLQRRDMTSLWQGTLKSRLSGTYLYLSACKMRRG